MLNIFFVNINDFGTIFPQINADGMWTNQTNELNMYIDTRFEQTRCYILAFSLHLL